MTTPKRKDLPPVSGTTIDITEPVDARPVRARRGMLGRCAACGEPAAEHFDDTGAFVGCAEGEPDTVFILVAANGRNIDPATIGADIALRTAATPPPHQPRPKRPRFARVARYRPADGIDRQIEALPLTDNRRRTLKALLAVHKRSKDGALAREITRMSGLPHGAVQESLRWLRDHKFASAVEDADSAMPMGPATTPTTTSHPSK